MKFLLASTALMLVTGCSVLASAPSQGTVQGHVLACAAQKSKCQKPLAGADVLFYADRSELGSATTDKTGSYWIALAPKTYTVVVLPSTKAPRTEHSRLYRVTVTADHAASLDMVYSPVAH